MLQLSTLVFSLLAAMPAVLSVPYVLYDNDFIGIPAKPFPNTTEGAQQSVIQWAGYLASQGPWSVMNKSIVPPSGDKHDYLSWSPYYWPNCSGVGNTTQLTPQQIWTTCPYVNQDGMINPDRALISDQAGFSYLADSVFYNSIAWTLTGMSNYSASAANAVKVWFIDPDTAMNPNLNYAQMIRGPGGQNGTHLGVLDLKTMTKLANGLLILRNGNNSDWTTELDNQMVAWTKEYIKWLQTNPLALQEGAATNNHGTYYYNQLSALQILVGDTSGALNSTNTYFSHPYLNQIDANGQQPLEANRTHPYHYRAYNLAAMIVNARIGKYLGTDYWQTKTSQGATIQTALDFAMVQNITASGDGPADEVYPGIAAVASTYGDPGGKYAAFIASGDSQYAAQPYFLWNQPLSGSATPTGAQTKSTSKSNARSISHDSVPWRTTLLVVPLLWALFSIA
jgi:hypothetical protein